MHLARNVLEKSSSSIKVMSFEGLLVDFAKVHNARVIVRSFRGAADMEYELPQAQMNRKLSGVETLFLSASPELSYISSTLVREIAVLGGDIAPFVDPQVVEFLRELG